MRAQIALSLLTFQVVEALPAQAHKGAPSLSRNTATSHLLRNISPSPEARRGTVVAARSGNSNYRYHWVRDAAIVMNEVTELLPSADGSKRAQYLAMLKDYVRLSWMTMRTATLTGLGEPKHTLKGRAFNEPWCRPQNDGPALRALSFLRLADWLLANGQERYVRRVLYRRDRVRGSPIPLDLDYVTDRWWNASFDLWEEESSYHLYTRAVQHAALVEGADLAARLGDTQAAARYREAAAQIWKALQGHWDPNRDILRASIQGSEHSGIDYKSSGLDAAVILAAIHTYGRGAPLHVLDERLLSTAHQIERSFRALYPTNRGRSGAVAIGRYPEDRYTGIWNDPPGQGNPWVLATYGFAEYYFRVARELGRHERVVVTRWNRPFFLAALGEPDAKSRLSEGTVLLHGSGELDALRAAIVQKGTGFLDLVSDYVNTHRRMNPHYDSGLSEQINLHTGLLQGAEHLTWSYAALLSALRARSEVER